MTTLKVNFEDKNLESQTLEGNFKGMSILDIVEDNGMHLSSNCGAVCACSTCHLYVLNGGSCLPEISDREEDFIDRAINPTLDSRLGCQCIIEVDEAQIEVTIPDQSLIISHEH